VAFVGQPSDVTVQSKFIWLLVLSDSAEGEAHDVFDMLSAVIMKLQDLSVFVEGLLGSQLSSPYCPMGTALSLQEGVRILFACINSS
jgi:hypothetical protein